MFNMRALDAHRTWEDWFGIALGVLIGLSPWLAGPQNNELVISNSVVIGVVVLLLAELQLVNLHRWQEIGGIACGLWLIASPFTFGYADVGALRYWHFVLGAVVVLLAVLEFWQDRRLGDKELVQDGL